MRTFLFYLAIALIILGAIHGQMYFEQWGHVGFLGPVAMAAGVIAAIISIFTPDR